MDFKELVIIKSLKIEKESIILNDNAIGAWCQRSYIGHKKGCPNYNKNLLCPPNSIYFRDIIDNYNHFYILYADFDFENYIILRKKEAEESEIQDYWTERRLRSVLYWQESVKKILKERVAFIYKINPEKEIFLLSCGSGFNDQEIVKYQDKIYSLESVGINVFSTLKLNNIKLEINPEKRIRLVCLFASVKKLNGLNLQKNCKICSSYFSSYPLSLNLFCEKTKCYDYYASHHGSYAYENISKVEHHYITQMKLNRSIPTNTFDLYDLDRPIIIDGEVRGYERVCRVCGSPLLDKKGIYNYHLRYCKSHRGYGTIIYDKYNWSFCAKSYLRKIQEKFYGEISTKIKEIGILEKHKPLTILCEECKKLCKAVNYYISFNTFALSESKQLLIKLDLINVHHIVPVHILTKENIHLIWEESNLICLCPECHWAKHRSEPEIVYKVDPIKYKTLDQFI